MEREFKEFLKALNIDLASTYYFSKRRCIRITSKEMQGLSLPLDRGLCIFSTKGPTSAFLPSLRKHVKESIEVDRETLERVSKGPVSLGWDGGFYILSYKGIPYFLVRVDGGKARAVV